MDPFERVVQAHGATVWRVCRALLPPADADDAWSETFLSAMRAYNDLRPDSNVKGWLVTIAHRKAIDQLRRSGRAPQLHAELAVEQSGLRSADAIPGEGLPAFEREALWAALAELTEKQRSAVVYHHVAGLPYIEIAELLGCSASAARRSAADGVARLRQIYPKESER